MPVEAASLDDSGDDKLLLLASFSRQKRGREQVLLRGKVRKTLVTITLVIATNLLNFSEAAVIFHCLLPCAALNQRQVLRLANN